MKKATASSDSASTPGTSTKSPETASATKGGISSGKATHKTYRFQVFCFIGSILLILLIAWLSSYVIAYTSDAYMDTNVVAVAPQVSGKVEQVFVHDNQPITAGELLFTLDPVPYQIQLSHAQGEYQSASAQLAIDRSTIESIQAEYRQDQAALHLANLTLQRNQTLESHGAYSRQSLDRASAAQQEAQATASQTQAQLAQARATLQLHQAEVNTARSNLHYAQWRLDQTRVHATVDGHVTNLTLEKGDMVSPDQGVLALVAGNNWHVLANYKEYLIRHLQPGHTVWVWLDAEPWHLYRGHVEGIAHAISRQEKHGKLVPYVSPTVNWIRLSRRIPVRIVLDHPPKELYSGSDARVIAVY